MQAEIVYLHIPKTAGKSQRHLLQSIYGKDRVYWHDDSNEATESEALVLGGHRVKRYYEDSNQVLYISLVRDPVEKVVSHFKWLAHPGYGKDRVHPERQALTDRWINYGLDVKSLENTVATCDKFREFIFNEQCRYITDSHPTLEGVRQTLRYRNWIIGSKEHSSKFHHHLVHTLGQPISNMQQINRPPVDYASKEELLTPKADKEISKLVREDAKLYRYIQEDWEGLYSHIERASHLPTILPNGHGRSYFMGSRWPILNNPFRAWRRLRVSIKGSPIKPSPDDLSQVTVKIENRSRTQFDPREYDNVQVMFHLYDARGKKLLWNICPSVLTVSVPAKSDIELMMPLWHPDEVLQKAHGIAVDLRAQDRYLLSRARLCLPRPVPFGTIEPRDVGR